MPRAAVPSSFPFMALAAGLLAAAPAAAQTRVPGDPGADDPAGIVADPCTPARIIDQGGGWQMWNLHLLTRDFGQLCRYAAADRALIGSREPVRVVFMGDSITDNWMNLSRGFWAEGRVDRGISGQTTPQMLVRFRQDVLDLHPRAVHIMAGTNDVAGNTGAATIETVEGNIRTMAELAHAHGIRVILASVPPAGAFPWAKEKNPVPQISALNAWLREYARANRYTFVDYFAALATPEGAMKPGLSSDGVHPTAAGYAIMEPIAKAAVARVLGR